MRTKKPSPISRKIRARNSAINQSDTELDDFDRKILVELQQDNLASADQLGSKIGLSASAVQRRLKRLRDSKIVSADVSIVDPKAVGRPMTLVVEVTLERESLDLFDAFKRRMRAAPEVQQCYYITGDGDFILIITAADMVDYQRIIENLFFQDKNMKRFRTSVVLGAVKTSWAIPIG
jgi:Lrp/AsnC family leucine-responsive transcriptional regulator